MLSVFVAERGRVIGVGILDFLAINRLSPFMRSMLSSARFGMVKFGKCFGNIMGHGNIHIPSRVVPF